MGQEWLPGLQVIQPPSPNGTPSKRLRHVQRWGRFFWGHSQIQNRPLMVGRYFMLSEAARLQDLQKNVSPYCDETVLKPDGRFSTTIANTSAFVLRQNSHTGKSAMGTSQAFGPLVRNGHGGIISAIPYLGTVTDLAGYQSVPDATGTSSLNGLSTVQRWGRSFGPPLSHKS